MSDQGDVVSGHMTGTGKRVEARLDLPADLASVSSARQFIRSELARNGRADVSDIVVLLTSEVVTNAIRHAGSPCRIDLQVDDDVVRVQVTDGSPAPVRPRRVPPDAESGRGLYLLDVLALDWGAFSRGAGKSVWFDVQRSPGRG
jgi:anti-sigma regulatory factor (Ser/Thr protein kinase)